METKAKFWIGLGVGSIVGAVASCLSRTEKAKEWKQKMCCAVEGMLEKAEGMAERAKDKALNAGDKFADKVSNVAHNAADKADEFKGRVHNATDETKR